MGLHHPKQRSYRPQTLAADRSVYALWPLAAGCHHIYIYIQGIAVSQLYRPGVIQRTEVDHH